MSYIFFKKGIERCCYWCAEDDKSKLTKDHLPPKSIFPKQERKDLQLITAPICNRCKIIHHKSDDDNIFLQHMLLWKSMTLTSVDINKRIENCIRYTPLSKDQKIVQAEFIRIELSNGQIVSYPVLKGDGEVIMRELDSIARAFYYRFRGEIIPEDVSPTFEFKPKDSFNPTNNPLTMMTPCIVKMNVFEFSPVLYEESNFRYLCWEFKFYNLNPLPIYYIYYL